jgi:hypothetical protein
MAVDTMTWNFCPNCGHRIYMHGDNGCGHVDEYNDGEYHRILCDCTRPHPLLVSEHA